MWACGCSCGLVSRRQAGGATSLEPDRARSLGKAEARCCEIVALFVSVLSPKAVVDYQTPKFLSGLYENHFSQNRLKLKRKHRIDRVIVIVVNRHFLHIKPYRLVSSFARSFLRYSNFLNSQIITIAILSEKLLKILNQTCPV